MSQFKEQTDVKVLLEFSNFWKYVGFILFRTPSSIVNALLNLKKKQKQSLLLSAV